MTPKEEHIMTRSCVTISLVEEARGGPFVFWDGLEDGCRRAHELGFDAVEVFPPGPDAVDTEQLRSLLDEHQLSLAAVGTGGGSLCAGSFAASGSHCASPGRRRWRCCRRWPVGCVTFYG